MIDTDKYALVIDDDGYFCEDKIADLLTEVKRLRGENERLHEAIRGCDSMKCIWLYKGIYKEMTKHD